MEEKNGNKRRQQARVTTARFNTEECVILLKVLNMTMEKEIIFLKSEDEYMTFVKIRKRLEDRIEKESFKNSTRRATPLNGKTEEDNSTHYEDIELEPHRETTYREYDLKGDIL